MNSAWHESDDALLQELGAALRAGDDDSNRTELLMTGYDLVNVDAPAAARIFDSWASPTAPVRSSRDVGPQLRVMRFSGDGFEIDVELLSGGLVGHVSPVAGGLVHLDTARGSTTATPDPELGSFEFEIREGISFRVRYVTRDAIAIATPWIGNTIEPNE